MTSTSAQPSRPRPRRLAVEGGAAPSSRPPERAAPEQEVVNADAAQVQIVDTQEGTITVRRIVFGAEHEEPAEAVRVPLFRTTPGRVSVKGGLTISMGNMEFARVDVEVAMPCYPEESEVNRTLDFCERIVGDRLTAQREMIESMTNGAEHEQQP